MFSHGQPIFDTGEITHSYFEKTGDINTSLSPFVIAPQRRRHSLWLPSPLNSINIMDPGVVSYDSSKHKVFKFHNKDKDLIYNILFLMFSRIAFIKK